MKFKFTWEYNIPDEEVLDIVNEQQEYDEFEKFNSLDECPKELILHALDVGGFIDDIIYDELDNDKVYITIVE